MRSRVRRKKFQNYLFFLGRHVHRTWESRAWSEHARSYLEPIKSQAFVSPLEARDNFKMLIGRSSFLAVTSPLHCFRRATTRASISCSLRFPELESDRCGCKTRSSDKNNRRKKKKKRKEEETDVIYISRRHSALIFITIEIFPIFSFLFLLLFHSLSFSRRDLARFSIIDDKDRSDGWPYEPFTDTNFSEDKCNRGGSDTVFRFETICRKDYRKRREREREIGKEIRGRGGVAKEWKKG